MDEDRVYNFEFAKRTKEHVEFSDNEMIITYELNDEEDYKEVVDNDGNHADEPLIYTEVYQKIENSGLDNITSETQEEQYTLTEPETNMENDTNDEYENEDSDEEFDDPDAGRSDYSRAAYTEEGEQLKELIINEYGDLGENMEHSYVTDMLDYLNFDLEVQTIINNVYDIALGQYINSEIEKTDTSLSMTEISWSLADIEQDGIPELLVLDKGINKETGLWIQEYYLYGFDYETGEFVAIGGTPFIICANDMFYSYEYKSLVCLNGVYYYRQRYGNEMVEDHWVSENDMDLYTVEYINFIHAYTIG